MKKIVCLIILLSCISLSWAETGWKAKWISFENNQSKPIPGLHTAKMLRLQQNLQT